MSATQTTWQPLAQDATDVTPQLAASDNWGQGGSFVFDPSTGLRQSADAAPAAPAAEQPSASADGAVASKSSTATTTKKG